MAMKKFECNGYDNKFDVNNNKIRGDCDCFIQ